MEFLVSHLVSVKRVDVIMILIELCLIPLFAIGKLLLSFTSNQGNTLLFVHFQSPSRSPCSNGDSVSRVDAEGYETKNTSSG